MNAIQSCMAIRILLASGLGVMNRSSIGPGCLYLLAAAVKSGQRWVTLALDRSGWPMLRAIGRLVLEYFGMAA